jgi:excisionase family DNA binding protein
MSTAPQSVVMSVQQFCEWSSIGRTKVYEEIATHRLKTLKVGRRRLIKRDEAQRWLDSHGSEAAA